MAALGLVLLALCWSLDALPAERRIALVIGNSAYPERPLRNPANDARVIAAALKRLGFEVILRENTRLADMLGVFGDFAVRSQSYAVRLVYYAGHGVQTHGRNYLIPVDADIHFDEEVRYKGVDIGELLDRLAERHDGLNIVILDACRNDPYQSDPRTASGGLADMAVPALSLRQREKLRGGAGRLDAPQGTLVAYATAPGAVAYDGDTSNSLYTGALLANIETPGLPLELLFKRVRQSVRRLTHDTQVPWENSSLVGDFCFASGANGRCPTDALAPAGTP
ncbi:MAG: caspase family protein [Rhodocyclaceae bacterium]|nr:caspase family protein [Rhodocyclaceae bacterium]